MIDSLFIDTNAIGNLKPKKVYAPLGIMIGMIFAGFLLKSNYIKIANDSDIANAPNDAKDFSKKETIFSRNTKTPIN